MKDDMIPYYLVSYICGASNCIFPCVEFFCCGNPILSMVENKIKQHVKLCHLLFLTSPNYSQPPDRSHLFRRILIKRLFVFFSL